MGYVYLPKYTHGQVEENHLHKNLIFSLCHLTAHADSVDRIPLFLLSKFYTFSPDQGFVCNIPLDSCSINHWDVGVWSVPEVAVSSRESCPSDYLLGAQLVAETEYILAKRTSPASVINPAEFSVVSMY